VRDPWRVLKSVCQSWSLFWNSILCWLHLSFSLIYYWVALCLLCVWLNYWISFTSFAYCLWSLSYDLSSLFLILLNFYKNFSLYNFNTLIYSIESKTSLQAPCGHFWMYLICFIGILSKLLYHDFGFPSIEYRFTYWFVSWQVGNLCWDDLMMTGTNFSNMTNSLINKKQWNVQCQLTAPKHKFWCH